MEYRLAAITDIPQLAEMRWDFRAHHDHIQTEELKSDFLKACIDFLNEALSSGRWTIWIAEENGFIISNIYIELVQKVPRPGRLHASIGYVTNVYTRQEFQNRGIGGNLIRCVQQWAKEETDLELLFLWPSKDSIPFYLREGFHPSGEILIYVVRPY